ncbi:hypothetical protein CUU65_05260 [Bacillus safensis]|nr:hypothetical protein BSL056_03670 [Bacillus safensis]NWF40083.1 hypothetical protein [Bacillus sp. 8A6]PNU23374.1 hypothetical protein C1954_11620 [Bacillus stratosphericus]AYJ90478.1 hypothetical protein CS953_12340 [Bacillus safensis]MBS4743899.1 hypothetical protein [Bacillus safensis]
MLYFFHPFLFRSIIVRQGIKKFIRCSLFTKTAFATFIFINEEHMRTIEYRQTFFHMFLANTYHENPPLTFFFLMRDYFFRKLFK